MLSLKPPRIQLWCRRTAWALLALVVIFWCASHLLLPGLIKKSLAEYGEKIGYEISYQDLSLSPLRLRVELDGLHLAKEGGSKLLEFQKLAITLKWTKLVLGELGFQKILLEEPKVLVEKKLPKGAHLGVWNWQELIASIEKSIPPSDPKESKKPLKISIDELLVSTASLHLVDDSTKLKEELKPFTVKLLDVANYDRQGVVTGVRGQYDFNLGALQVLIPGINKIIAYQHVAIAGGLDNPQPGKLGVQLNLMLDDGDLRSHWDFNTDSKSVEGKVKIEGLAIAPIIALVPANKELIGKSGAVNADLVVKFGGGVDSVSGDIHVSDLAILEKGQKYPLIVWKVADIRQLEYKSVKSKQSSSNSLAIDELIINAPTLQFEINEEGFSNFRRLFSKPTTETKAEPVTTPKTDAPSAFSLDIRSMNLKSGEVYFSDMAMRPNFKVDVKKFNATLLGVSNTPGRFATVAMDGVVAGSGSMRAKGQASFDDPRRNHDILMAFRNLPLTTFNPAVMTFAGYQITSGRLNLNLNYKAKDGELNGSNQIIIKKVVLGDEVPDFTGKKLPLGLAIALLEDSDDTIDVTVRIAGNVDSPEFSASGLVWQAISNVLTNVATAPFRALASILGMGGEEGVNAVPGEAVFLVADQDRLEKFGEYLVKRPNSSLEIIGTYDPVQDKKELARAKADGAILLDAGFKLAPGEPVPTPSFTDPKVQSGLLAAYAQYIGRIKLGQRLLTLPDGEKRNEQLHEELIAGIEITDAELKELAKSRAKTAFGFMVKTDPSLKDRIQLGDVKSVEAGKEGIPLDVEIRIK
ncbi:DUF748 domain-containing protein [Polynucleobacter sp. AP-Kaivos-20-H2]|uniref:DUF748 domain-containing protein n=1 Tax=Polynucleobacter sp. AP-Kaivos-20-H2 TaxID=2689104 RepID=UPI001C0E65D1|nr:DUF748 domain-containing protein [Polynucleobacter sp. AP-Kaivos-20-H2]MBU3603457.1 DUF748 domain-containing protein [Polynucleobacter sp. AP-Kaivos-20-H2]